MVGTSPYLRKYFKNNWSIFEYSKVGISIKVGLEKVQKLPLKSSDAIFVSLGTNNFYTQYDYFVKSVNELRKLCGKNKIIIWATISRPLTNEYTYISNPYLPWNNYMRTRRDHRFGVADWEAKVVQQSNLLENDKVHATREGYKIRAELYYDAAAKLGLAY